MLSNTNVKQNINDAIDLLDAVLEDGFAPTDYTLGEVEQIRDRLNSMWEEIEGT